MKQELVVTARNVTKARGYYFFFAIAAILYVVSMQSVIRESVFGQFCRLVTKSRFLQYADEKECFNLPDVLRKMQGSIPGLETLQLDDNHRQCSSKESAAQNSQTYPIKPRKVQSQSSTSPNQGEESNDLPSRKQSSDQQAGFLRFDDIQLFTRPSYIQRTGSLAAPSTAQAEGRKDSVIIVGCQLWETYFKSF